MHKVAGAQNDAHLTNYLEGEFLEEQVESINKIAKMHTNLLRVGDGLGVYIFDKDLQ
jgi:ferritin heavy chain